MTESHPLGGTLTRQIIFALIAGAVVGMIVNLGWGDNAWVQTNLVDGVFDTVGQLFVRALKMLIVPLVFVSLVCGTSSLSDPSRLGRLGVKTMGLYLMTTAIAVTTALIFAEIFNPGLGASYPTAEYTPEQGKSVKEVILALVPENPLESMVATDMLPIIVFSIMVGLAITMAGESGRKVKDLFGSLNEVVMGLVIIVMRFAPIGVFALIGKLFASTGIDSIGLIADYFLLVMFVLIFHAMVTYGLLIRFLGGLNPLLFFRKMRAAMLFAVSTSSSNATLPVTLRTVERRLGVDNSVASFTVPLGATINMDGTAIMQGIATVFIANVYGVDLSLTQLLMVVFMATMASIGAAGVPGVGLILLAGVLDQVGLPVEGIGIILGIDRPLDMLRTAVNVTGDATVTTIVGRSEQEFDQAIFEDPTAGEDVLSAKTA